MVAAAAAAEHVRLHQRGARALRVCLPSLLACWQAPPCTRCAASARAHHHHIISIAPPPPHHLFERVVTVVRLARPAGAVDHHEVQHAVGAELVEAALANGRLGLVGKRAECARAAPRARLRDKRGVQEPVGCRDGSSGQLGRAAWPRVHAWRRSGTVGGGPAGRACRGGVPMLRCAHAAAQGHPEPPDHQWEAERAARVEARGHEWQQQYRACQAGTRRARAAALHGALPGRAAGCSACAPPHLITSSGSSSLGMRTF